MVDKNTANLSIQDSKKNVSKNSAFNGIKFVILILLISIASSFLVPYNFLNNDLIKAAKNLIFQTTSSSQTSKVKPLILPEELNNLMESKNFNEKFRIIETSFGTEQQNEFNQGHIPNAIFFDTMNGVKVSKLYPKNLPSERSFKEYLSELGISNKHHVIIYDRSQFGFFSSSRVWFIFRLYGHESVSILSGGFNGWKSKKYPISTEIINFKKETFETKLNSKLLRDYEDIKNIASKNEIVMDARERSDFNKVVNGKVENILNSKNVPYSELFDNSTGTIKSEDKLKELFKNNEVDLKNNMVSSCYTGVKASSLAFATYLLGAKNIPLYSGSWTEYSQRINMA